MTKSEANEILVEMNKKAKEMPFADLVKNEHFEDLRIKLLDGDWCALVDDIKRKNGKLHVRFRLCHTTSKEFAELCG